VREFWVLSILTLVPSVILHEIAHGAVALWFGDDTAKRAGRLTLNPVPHVDPFGTVLLPLLLGLSGAGAFGWAKPVPVNPRRLRDPRNHSLLVSLAGPGTNVALAALSLLWFATRPANTAALASVDFDLVSYPDAYFFTFGVVNVLLAAFNLIPIPPLDGSALVERVLPARAWPGWLRFRQYSMGIVLLLVLAVPGALQVVFDPALRLWANLL
jgi:Zn-dependent protease